jgi:hypothetical protein
MLLSGALLPALAALLAIALGAAALLKGWQGWLDLERMRIDAGPNRAGRSEVGELRERVRRLERIALGLE